MTDVFFEIRIQERIFVACLARETRMPKVSASQIDLAFAEHLKASGSADLIFDLNGASYLSSWCLGAMLKTQRASFQKRGRAVVCNFQEEILEQFESLKLDRSFLFRKDLASALALLKNGGSDPPPGSLTSSRT